MVFDKEKWSNKQERKTLRNFLGKKNFLEKNIKKKSLEFSQILLSCGMEKAKKTFFWWWICCLTQPIKKSFLINFVNLLKRQLNILDHSFKSI